LKFARRRLGAIDAARETPRQIAGHRAFDSRNTANGLAIGSPVVTGQRALKQPLALRLSPASCQPVEMWEVVAIASSTNVGGSACATTHFMYGLLELPLMIDATP
jgi:hypothetical protein